MAGSMFGAGNAQRSLKYLILPESKETIKDRTQVPKSQTENGTKTGQSEHQEAWCLQWTKTHQIYLNPQDHNNTKWLISCLWWILGTHLFFWKLKNKRGKIHCLSSTSYNSVTKLLQREYFFIERFELINDEEVKELEQYHVAAPNEYCV